MNVDLLYPDNRNRGNRVKQLVTQITSIQNEARLNKSAISDQLKTVEAKFPDVLHAHGLQSVAELKEKLKNTLPQELKDKYLDLLKYYDEDVAGDNQVIDVIGLIIMASGGGAMAAKMIEVVVTGKLATALNYAVRALITAAKDADAAKRLINLASAIIKSFSSEAEVGETALKALKWVKAAGTVISVIGVFIDVIILAISAIKGAQQRSDLEAAINDLAYRRFTAEAITLMGEVYAQYISSLYSLVVRMKNKMDIQSSVDEMCEDLKKGVENVTFEKVRDALTALDDSDSTTWKDKDPTTEALKKWWDDGNNPTEYKGPIPSHDLKQSQ